MTLPELHFYPLICAILFPFTFALTYTISVLLKHTEVDWPYISDTGAYPPESCIFGQLLNVGALFVGITVYIRYKQVREFYRSHQYNARRLRLNYAALWIGWIGALGISIVANFQETSVGIVHLIGAIMAFGIGSVYLWTQVFASYHLVNLCHGRWILILRGFLAFMASSGFVVMLVTGIVAASEFHGSSETKWHPGDGGWVLHVVSTVHEWVLAISYMAFVLTFVPEFKQVTLDSPQICLRINRLDLLIQGQSEMEASYAESVTSTEEHRSRSNSVVT